MALGFELPVPGLLLAGGFCGGGVGRETVAGKAKPFPNNDASKLFAAETVGATSFKASVARESFLHLTMSMVANAVVCRALRFSFRMRSARNK